MSELLCRKWRLGVAPRGRGPPPLSTDETQKDSLHARVWQLHIRPGKAPDFKDTLSSVVHLARQQEGYRGALSLCSGKSHSPDVTLVAPWDSLEKIRGSENNLFLTEEISRYLVCCEGLSHITVQELLACDFIATSPRAI